MQKRTAIMEKEIKNYGFVNAVYDESPYGIIVFNSALNITDWNPAVEKLIGLSKNDCLGKNMVEVFGLHNPIAKKGTNNSNIRGTMVVAEPISGMFLIGFLNGIKISTIIDKSGTISGGTLIITAQDAW